MAYVSISQELINEVSNKLGRMRSAELSAMPDTDKFGIELLAAPGGKDYVDSLVWGPLLDIKSRLDAENLTTNLTVHFQLGKGSVNLPSYLIPRRSTNSYYMDVKASMETAPEELRALLRRFEETFTQREECAQRWKTVEKQVKDFLNKCKSLNEALKLWPDVRRYVDTRFLERVEKKVERSASAGSDAAEALKAIDMDTVQASTVLARMAGAV